MMELFGPVELAHRVVRGCVNGKVRVTVSLGRRRGLNVRNLLACRYFTAQCSLGNNFPFRLALDRTKITAYMYESPKEILRDRRANHLEAATGSTEPEAQDPLVRDPRSVLTSDRHFLDSTRSRVAQEVIRNADAVDGLGRTDGKTADALPAVQEATQWFVGETAKSHGRSYRVSANSSPGGTTGQLPPLGVSL